MYVFEIEFLVNCKFVYVCMYVCMYVYGMVWYGMYVYIFEVNS